MKTTTSDSSVVGQVVERLGDTSVPDNLLSLDRLGRQLGRVVVKSDLVEELGDRLGRKQADERADGEGDETDKDRDGPVSSTDSDDLEGGSSNLKARERSSNDISTRSRVEC